MHTYIHPYRDRQIQMHLASVPKFIFKWTYTHTCMHPYRHIQAQMRLASVTNRRGCRVLIAPKHSNSTHEHSVCLHKCRESVGFKVQGLHKHIPCLHKHSVCLHESRARPNIHSMLTRTQHIITCIDAKGKRDAPHRPCMDTCAHRNIDYTSLLSKWAT